MRVAPSALALLLAACSSAPGPSAVTTSQVSLASPPPAEAHEPGASAPATGALPRSGPLPDDAIVEGPGSRDPFRAFPEAPRPPPPDARPRRARRIPVDQLKLVGLVTNTPTPRALLVDPAGKGYIVTQGELVGRPEPVGPAGASGDDGERYASFRVDRIREGDVVLVREDAAGRSPVSTRVLSLPRQPLLQADD
jgi:type IV pilus assembly protein PilP